MFLFLWTLLLGALPPSPSWSSALRVSPPAGALRIAPVAPSQGQVLFVTAPGLSTDAQAVLTWDSKRYPIYSRPSEWRGVIPVRIEERPGRHMVRLTYRTAAGSRRTLAAAVTVGRTQFPTQQLSMARSIERLYTYPGRKKELAMVRHALFTETSQQQWRGDFLIPIHGHVTTWFGERRIRNGRLVGDHRGLDIGAPTGTPIRADNAGRVILARALTMHGKTVVIDHGLGVTSIFLHQSAIRCHEGQIVHRGDLIGAVGQTGVATGPHLHWAVYVHGIAVSPLFWTHLPRL